MARRLRAETPEGAASCWPKGWGYWYNSNGPSIRPIIVRNFFATLRCGWVHIQSCYTASKSAKCLRWTTWRGCQIPRHRGSNPAIRTNEKRLNHWWFGRLLFLLQLVLQLFCGVTILCRGKWIPVYIERYMAKRDSVHASIYDLEFCRT